ncbi:uncharacterized protein FIESC28_06618 [Fusarium coffeatum]|uniref:Uncharacterized protein n=1 Tax=Fusarium coffeatum TaxID=231269 RepID=A0A366RL26_9HYPO|nr:uncharacterized protein FIESC28_06618 [Fusarium coffeatum]RBR17116.1 hypothetical protein FIESC28_06618 [Fusarium coffeatum]
MRFSTTVLVAIQASMGLAHAIPPPFTKYLDKIDNRVEEDHERRGPLTEFRKKFFKGYEVAKSTTRHTFLVPEDSEYEAKKHHHDNEHGTTNYHPHGHESEDRHDMKNKYEPQRHHVSEKPRFKTHQPEGDYSHEEHYHHSESYDNPKTGHHHNDYNYETEYPSEEHKDKKDYPTESFDPSDDRYDLNEHDFDKYFIKDHDASSKKHESDDIGDPQGSPSKRWTSKGDVMGQWWQPSKSREHYRNPNKEHTHSHKYKVEPRFPDTTKPWARHVKYTAKEIRDLHKAKEHGFHMPKPGYHLPEKYEAEVEDQEYSHFNKHQKENDNLPYFDKYRGKYLPKQPFEKKRKFVPKAEYGAEDDTHHSYAREHYKKPDYEKEDEQKYGPDSEEKYHEEEYSEKKGGNSKLKGFYDFNFGHNPEEGKFLDDESYTTKHGGSGEPEEITFKKYYPKKSDKEDKEDDPHTARKYGYRKYHPKKHSASNEEKMHDHKREEKELNYSEEDKKYEYKKVYYPTKYEPKENTKFYRKQEVGHEDHGFKSKPHSVEHHTHYYDEPGYENVVPGFMWAGPGAVTKTPCASKEGCPYGHWHMLEPKDGEHRRIGITGTNIVVEPDYSRPDYKEDIVNHVLPGYEKVIPGFEWAGPGRVTEVPCPSVTDCPQGGWFMLAPRYGEHRRIAMNYPKATPTPRPHPHPQPHSTMHFPQPGYKPPTPVGYEGRAQEKDHDENEGEYKLIHRHSSHMGKRSIEARTPCGKKDPKEPKKLDPNKPLPTLTVQQLWNFERLSTAKRKDIVKDYPWMDEELKKEFPKFKELTPRLITKLNEFWAILHLDRQANMIFIEVMKRKVTGVPRKRATPELSDEESNKIEALSKRADPKLSKDQIKRIEASPSFARRIAAGSLDFDPKLTEELANARGKFSAKLIAKLNKEYARIMSDPKYKDIRERYLPNSKKSKRNAEEEKHYSKRSEPQLSEREIKKIEGLSYSIRGIVAKKLDLNPELTAELVKTDKLSDELIAKLNVEYARIKSDPKYKDILNKFFSSSKRAETQLSKKAIKKIESLPPRYRAMVAKQLDLDPKVTRELVEYSKISDKLVKKLNVEYRRIKDDPKYKDILDKFLSSSKREEPKLSRKMISKLMRMSRKQRKRVAKMLDMNPKLTKEWVRADKTTDELVAKLNVEYARVYKDPKYEGLLRRMGSLYKRRGDGKDYFGCSIDDWHALMDLTPKERKEFLILRGTEEKVAEELSNIERWTQPDIEKLEVEYQRFKSIPEYRRIHYGNPNMDPYEPRKVKRESEAPGITQKQLDRIIGSSSSARRIAARQLGMSLELSEEIAYADEFSPELIKKLDNEYRRIKSDPKYSAVLKKFGNNKSKRDSYHKENNHLANNDHEKRQLVPSTMNITQTEPDSDWEVDLSPQFKYAQALTEEFIERFADMIHDKVEEAKKQRKLDTEATPRFNATKALDELIAGNSNETVSSQNATDLTAPQATGNLNTTKLLEPQDAAGQNVAEIAADQPASNQTSKDGELKDKLEQSKKNGWCNEFLGGLEDTLKESVEAAQEEVGEAAETAKEKFAKAAEKDD